MIKIFVDDEHTYALAWFLDKANAKHGSFWHVAFDVYSVWAIWEGQDLTLEAIKQSASAN